MNAADLVIRELSDYAAQLEAEMAVSRELLSAALTRLSDADRSQRDLHARFEALRDELRRYTAAKVPDA